MFVWSCTFCASIHAHACKYVCVCACKCIWMSMLTSKMSDVNALMEASYIYFSLVQLHITCFGDSYIVYNQGLLAPFLASPLGILDIRPWLCNNMHTISVGSYFGFSEHSDCPRSKFVMVSPPLKHILTFAFYTLMIS